MPGLLTHKLQSGGGVLGCLSELFIILAYNAETLVKHSLSRTEIAFLICAYIKLQPLFKLLRRFFGLSHIQIKLSGDFEDIQQVFCVVFNEQGKLLRLLKYIPGG